MTYSVKVTSSMTMGSSIHGTSTRTTETDKGEMNAQEVERFLRNQSYMLYPAKLEKALSGEVGEEVTILLYNSTYAKITKLQS